MPVQRGICDECWDADAWRHNQVETCMKDLQSEFFMAWSSIALELNYVAEIPSRPPKIWVFKTPFGARIEFTIIIYISGDYMHSPQKISEQALTYVLFIGLMIPE